MNNKAEQLISDLKANGWNTNKPYERLFELCKNPDDVFFFAKEFLKSFDKDNNLFNASLSYVEETHFKQLIDIAIGILKVKQTESAESVIASASLQFPILLHKYSELIFKLNPNGGSYYENYPWRNLDRDKIEIFKTILISPKTDLFDKEKAFECLLETRDIETIIFACNYTTDSNFLENDNLEDYLTSCLELVGFTKRNNEIISYCPNPIRHFSFVKDYFSNEGPIHTSKEQHPTWNLEATNQVFKFGGVLENDDKNPFFHLITFDRIPTELKINGLDTLVLGVHVRELNEYGEIFYQHDFEGKPAKINLGNEQNIEVYEDQPIIETQIRFAVTPKRWERQDWAGSNSRENLFRLGGEPTWIQSAEVLICPVCKEKMDFLLQLDSYLPDIDEGETMYGSGGICYVFWCDKSKVSGYIMQCT